MTQWGLDTLFNPAKRHMDDEKNRLQSTREEVGDNSGGKRIDLESGKVVIARQDEVADEPDAAKVDARAKRAAARAAEKERAAKERAAKDRGGRSKKSPAVKDEPASGASGPTAAQIRAAKRRGRDIG